MNDVAELGRLLAAQAQPPCARLTPFQITGTEMGPCNGEGRIIKAGRSLAFLEARLWGGDGELAIHATATVGIK